MTEELKIRVQQITEKVKNDQPLTDQEEILYLVHVLNHTEQEASRILYIAKNTRPGVLID